jgi:hypothetical protein
MQWLNLGSREIKYLPRGGEINSDILNFTRTVTPDCDQKILNCLFLRSARYAYVCPSIDPQWKRTSAQRKFANGMH